MQGASNLAEENLKSNLSAMPQGFELEADLPDSEVVFAREGTLTCKINGQWMSGCSVPAAAARELLATMKMDCPTGVFLEPSHPAQVRSALNKLLPRQAIIALVPDRATLSFFLLCENFSADLRAGRLFFGTGAQLSKMLASNIGLPVPRQFIKTRLLRAERAEALIGELTPVINAENARRNGEMNRLYQTIKAHRDGKWAVFTPMDFHPGDYAARHLAKIAGDQILINADRADQTSPLGLLMSLQNARGLLAPRLTRKDVPFVPVDFPIVTWVLKAPIPQAGNPGDVLLVPTREMRKQAMEMGWRRVELAAPAPERWTENGRDVFVFGDARWTPAGERDFLHSSHRLLYEAIGNELAERPFNLTEDVASFLAARAVKLDIRPRDLDARVFVDELIFPAFTQGILKFMKERGIRAIKPTIENWERWDQTMRETGVIVNARPFDAMATLEYSGRAVVNPLGLSAEEFLARLRKPDPVGAGLGPVLDLSSIC
jgi:hypothetical protein